MTWELARLISAPFHTCFGKQVSPLPNPLVSTCAAPSTHGSSTTKKRYPVDPSVTSSATLVSREAPESLSRFVEKRCVVGVAERRPVVEPSIVVPAPRQRRETLKKPRPDTGKPVVNVGPPMNAPAMRHPPQVLQVPTPPASIPKYAPPLPPKKEPLPAYGTPRGRVPAQPVASVKKPKHRPPPLVIKNPNYLKPVFAEILVASPLPMDPSEYPKYTEDGRIVEEAVAVPPPRPRPRPARTGRKPSPETWRHGMVQAPSTDSDSDWSDSEDTDYGSEDADYEETDSTMAWSDSPSRFSISD